MNKIPVYFCLLVFLLSCNLFNEKKNVNLESTEAQSPDTEIEKITAAISKEPGNASLYYERGLKYRSRKLDSLALIDFRKSISLDSNRAEYYSAIGDLLFEHKDITGSVKWFEKALTFNPDDQTAHLKMAKLFLYIEEYPKAFVEINTVLRSDVYNAEAYFLKGMCYKNMKDTNRAISSFQTAVQSNPKYAEAFMQLALIYDAKGDPLSLKYFENAYKSDSTDLEPVYGQAMYWQKLNNFAEAKKVYRRMVNIDRTYARSYYNTGWILMQEDSTEKALRQFDIAIQNKPDYADAYYNRGLCKEILKQYPEALEDYNQALSFQSENAMYKAAANRVRQKTK